MSVHLARRFLLPGLLVCLGCQGIIGDPTTEHRPPDVDPELPELPTVDECLEAPLALGAGPLSRLTQVQYRNTLRDLLGLETSVADGFVADDRVAGFHAARTISALQVEKYLEAARSLTADLDVGALTGCAPSEACARSFVERFGRRAFRRPLTAEERTDLFDTWSVGAESSFEDGVRLVVEAVLASPDFLYHVEVGGAAGEIVPLGNHALASRLSYFLWNSMPDDALLDAADGVEIDMEAQAWRLLADDRFRDTVHDFYAQWVSLDRVEHLVKDERVYPEMNAELSRDLRNSLDLFVQSAHFGEQPTFETLMRGETFYSNARIASVYGGSSTSEDLEPSTGRRGLLEQPGLLALFSKANQSDPIHRGIFVREGLLCQNLPEPPADVDLIVREPEPGLSTRDRFAEHTANAVCADCHRLIDPIGFGFEAFDGIGRERTEDEGVAIDSTGEVLMGGDASGTFDSLRELSDQLADSQTVQQCFATQWFRFALRRAETPADACSLTSVAARFQDSGGRLDELLVGIATSDAFRHRQIPTEAEGEVRP